MKVHIVFLHFMTNCSLIPDRAEQYAQAQRYLQESFLTKGEGRRLPITGRFLANSDVAGTKDQAQLYNFKTGKQYMKVCSHQELRISSSRAKVL